MASQPRYSLLLLAIVGDFLSLLFLPISLMLYIPEDIPPNHSFLTLSPSNFLPHFSTTQSSLVVGKTEGEGEQQLWGKEKVKFLYFHPRTLVLANPSISELPGEEKERV